jgi:hypothetical protein
VNPLVFVSPLLLLCSTHAAEFAALAKPFLDTHCTGCHGLKKQKGKLSLHEIGLTDSDTWLAVLEQLEIGDMPPEDADSHPSLADRQAMIDWITAEFAVDRHALQDDPARGNRVNHDALFSGAHKGPAYSPSRLWRISPHISTGRYARDRLGKHLHGASQPFSHADHEGIKDYASLWHLDGPTLELLLLNADQLVSNQIGPPQAEMDAMDEAHHLKIESDPEMDEKRKKSALRKKPSQNVLRWSSKEIRALAFAESAPSPLQIEGLIHSQYQLVLSRSPDRHEVDRLQTLFAEAIAAGGNLEGIRAGLTAIMMSPEAIYRLELGLGQKTPDGRRHLSAQELAFALSYALRDGGPDKELLAAAADGSILKPAVMAEQVSRMIDVERFGDYRRNPAQRLLRFFQEFFGYTEAPGVFKDGSRHPGHRHQPDRLVDDTNAFVTHIIREDKDVLRRLLTSNAFWIYAKQKDFRLTFASYGISLADTKAYVSAHTPPKDMPKAEQKAITEKAFINGRGRFELPRHERAGMLTQPSWLAAHSTNFDNDPVRRGKWIYERLLAGNILDVPITVDAQVPADHDKTLRERFEKTRAEACWKCHRKMNPLGMAFEIYDDVGRYRSEELLRDNTSMAPINARAAIPGQAGELKDAIELMHTLADSARVRQSFVRHAFRYWMGRNETLDDSPTLLAADAAFVDSKGSMKALITALVISDSFRYRK